MRRFEGGSQPEPQPGGRPPFADVEVVSITPGLYFTAEGETGFEELGLLFVPVLAPDPGTRGFQRFTDWYAGDRIDIQVVVRNGGPSPAAFNLNVTPLTKPEDLIYRVTSARGKRASRATCPGSKKRPPKGRYTVLVRRRPASRATAEQLFGRSLRNLFRIRIR